jgi:orotate phosphoribosyltransferase
LEKLSNESEKTAKILLEIGAFSLSPRKPFRWVSGILAPIYTDMRLLMGFPEQRRKIVEMLAEQSNALEFDVIAGIATSGIPFAAWLWEKMDTPMVFIRKEAKEYGKQQLIEGKLEPRQRVLLVEEIVSTGQSSMVGVNALREANAKITDCVSISYNTENALKVFEEANVRLHSLTSVFDLVKTAAQEKYINESEKQSVLRFLKNPKEWAKNEGLD